MGEPRIVSPQQWRAERIALLAQEKQLTQQRDALNRARRELPMTVVGKDYVFEGPQGRVPLAGLFEGRRQLIVYHFMYHRDRQEGCEGCSFLTDNIGHLSHLHARDTTLVLVSRAPLAELEAYRRRMGWNIPWYSSWGSDFNYDYHVSIDPAVAPVEYNYRDQAELQRRGESEQFKGELPGISVFVRDGDRVLHSYSSYARGLEMVMSSFHFLDLTPQGRGEGWDGMPDLDGKGMRWVKLHDRYDTAPQDKTCCGH